MSPRSSSRPRTANHDRAPAGYAQAGAAPARHAMFVSFFPRPVPVFFASAAIWTVLCVGLWYAAGADIGRALGFAIPEVAAAGEVGVQVFWSPAFLWFYCYYAVAVAAFMGF